MEEVQRATVVSLAYKVVGAYVRNNSASPDSVVQMLQDLIRAGEELRRGEAVAAPRQQAAIPAVPIEESVSDDYIICLEDGLRFKSLRRHLTQKYNMTPDEYRAKWGLPANYPMIAPGYAKFRSEIAKAREQQKRERLAAPAEVRT